MIYTQKQIYDYLLENPLNVSVHIGDLEDMQGQDWIFFDYLNDVLIPSDDEGCYRADVQFTIATKDFDNRKVLVDYLKQNFNLSISYERSDEFNYYLARCECGILVYG